MARKTKFHFNPETLSYEKVETTTWGIVKKVGLHLLTSLFSGAIFFFIFIWLVESPEEKQLSSENARMKVQYKLMERRIGDLQSAWGIKENEIRNKNTALSLTIKPKRPQIP